MKKVAFFFDLDGTLVDDDFSVNESSIYALDQLHKNGYKIFISTGRDFRMIKHLKADKLAPWDGMVCSNGQIIYDENENQLSACYFDEAEVRVIIQRIEEIDHCSYVALCGDYSLAPKGINANTRESLLAINELTDDIQIRPFDENIDQVSMMMVYTIKEDFNYEVLIEGCSAKLHITPYNYADINILNISKVDGIKKMIEIMKLHDHQIVVFGDGRNDLEALAFADLGIVMGNAQDFVKKEADIVAEPLKDDGVYKTLLQLGFIKAK